MIEMNNNYENLLSQLELTWENLTTKQINSYKKGSRIEIRRYLNAGVFVAPYANFPLEKRLKNLGKDSKYIWDDPWNDEENEVFSPEANALYFKDTKNYWTKQLDNSPYYVNTGSGKYSPSIIYYLDKKGNWSHYSVNGETAKIRMGYDLPELSIYSKEGWDAVLKLNKMFGLDPYRLYNKGDEYNPKLKFSNIRKVGDTTITYNPLDYDRNRFDELASYPSLNNYDKYMSKLTTYPRGTWNFSGPNGDWSMTIDQGPLRNNNSKVTFEGNVPEGLVSGNLPEKVGGFGGESDFTTINNILEKYGIKFKKGGKIHIKKKNRGKFTAAAKRAGMGVLEYASKVLRDPNASPQLKKRANFARNAKKWNHG